MAEENHNARLTIFWDVENVHDENQTHDRMTEAIRDYGTLVKAYAFADWDTRRKMAEHLYSLGYDLIHIPDSRDNASDYKMASYIMDHFAHYQEVTDYVMITGDGDFKLLAGALREKGLNLWLISNPVITSSELTDLATKYSDIYSFRPSLLDCSNPEDCISKSVSVEARQIAGVKLREAVELVIKAGHKPGVGHVKHVVKLLNPHFDERTIGFESWMDFVLWAKTEGYITVEGDLPSTILGVSHITSPETQRLSDATKSAFDTLVKVIENRIESDQSTTLDVIDEEFKDKGVDYRNIGFPKIEDFIASAEKRGLVRVVALSEISNDPTIQPICTIERLRTWFEKNITKYFGQSVNVPKDVFLEKIVKLLHDNGVTLRRLEEYLNDKEIQQKYRSVLETSGLPFLPPFQMIMATVLLGKGRSCENTIAQVNDELTPLSITLHCPV